MPKALTGQQIEVVFRLLGGRLEQNGVPPVGIVVCGGAAMIVLELLPRTTTDVDIVAMLDASHDVSPGFLMLLKKLLESIGYGNVAEKL